MKPKKIIKDSPRTQNESFFNKETSGEQLEKISKKEFFFRDRVRGLVKNPWTHLVFLALLLIFFYSQSTIRLMDDSFYYQEFTETLVDEGRVDLSVPGFHGADFLTAPIYLLTRSPYSVAILDMIAAILNIFLIYLAAKEIFKNKTMGVMAAYIYLLNPLDYTNPLRGHHHTPLIMLILLSLYLLFKDSKLTFLPLGLSYIVRPFGIALAPLFLYKKKIGQFLLSLTIPAIYALAQYSQIGKLYIGVHRDLTAQTLFSINRFILNLGYAFQNYFSIHNYSFLNPVTPENMIHLSPFITFFALFGVMYYKKYFTDKKLFLALAMSSLFALVLPASFFHLDMWHLWTFNLTLILLALPVLIKFPKILPIIVLSFFFQFLYTYLELQDAFSLNYTFFVIPLIIFAISLVYAYVKIFIEKDATK